jgi:hypothetical protein
MQSVGEIVFFLIPSNPPIFLISEIESQNGVGLYLVKLDNKCLMCPKRMKNIDEAKKKSHGTFLVSSAFELQVQTFKTLLRSLIT